MLAILRKKGVTKKVLWIILSIVIVSFGFGVGISQLSDTTSSNKTAGKAFGKKISTKQFQDHYRATLDQAILMHGEKVRDILPYIDMDNETWTRILLIKEADQRKIKVSDTEVIGFVQSLSMFQEDGAFRKGQYEMILNRFFQRNPRDFEEGIRNQIKIMKLLQSETAGQNIPQEAIRKEYERRNQKIQVSYTLIHPSDFKDQVAIEQPALESYYNDHIKEFSVPDSINVQYLTLPLMEDASDETQETALEQAQEIFDALAENDIAMVAKNHNLQVSETGFINMQRPPLDLGWPLELFQQVFTAELNTILEPSPGINGITIAKVIEKKPAYTPAFAEVANKVEESFLKHKTVSLAQQKAAEIYPAILQSVKSQQTFKTAVEPFNLNVATTPFFAPGDYIPEIGISENFETSAKTLDNNRRLSDVTTTAKGPVIIYWEASEPIDEGKYDEEKEDFTNALYQEEHTKATNRVIRGIKERAQLKSYLEDLKKEK